MWRDFQIMEIAVYAALIGLAVWLLFIGPEPIAF